MKRMKSMNKLTILAVTAAFAAATSAFATPEVKVTGNPWQNNEGGEFTVIPNAEALSALGTPNLAPYISSYNALALYGNGFQSFCLEKNEEVNLGSSYPYGVSTGAISGGNGGGNPDVVSRGVGFLYSEFAKGNLAGYFSANDLTRNQNAGLLQAAIWSLEDETPDKAPGINVFYDLAVNHFGSIASAKTDGGYEYGVYALNLGTNVQDVLIYKSVPDGGTTLMLIGIAFGGVSFLRRKISAQ